MKFKIQGNNLPSVEINLDDNESVFTESGAMSWMSFNIEMETTTGGGLLKGIGRMFAGESLFIINFTSKGKGHITFTSEFPGKIVPFKLKDEEQIIFQKDSFLCAEKSVKLDIHFNKKIGVGLFSGEGFIMQKATGPGHVFLEVDGDVVEMNLKSGEEIKVDTGHIAIFEPSVHYDYQVVSGFKNKIFGGEGLFLATLKGPGKVWLQTMPIRNLALRIHKYLPASGGKGNKAGINFGDVLERI